MKAIQIKYMGPTNTKGARWKVWAESTRAKYYSRSYDLDGRDDALKCANDYLDFIRWDEIKIAGFGMLPNGDYVAVLERK